MRLFRLWQSSGNDLRILWAALRQPNRPKWLVPATVALAAFAFDPFNLLLPALGLVDDVILLPILLGMLARFAGAPSRLNDITRSREDRVVSEQ